MRRFAILLAAVGALMLLPAAQAFAAGTLTVEVEGEGSAEISSVGGDPSLGGGEGSPPIECSYEFPLPAEGTCESELEEVEPGLNFLGLHAVLPEGFTVSWKQTGGLAFSCPKEYVPNRCSPLAFGENVTVTATIEEAAFFPLTVAKTGSGTGTVVDVHGGQYGEGIDCGSECEAEYVESLEVTLKAEADEGSEFTGWTGCEKEVEAGNCSVTMSEAKEVEANFEAEAAEVPLTLNINGGEGTVVSDPAGLECTGAAPESCEAEFEENAEVTLTASPAAGNRFWFWESCPSPEGHKCTVTMDEAKSVGVQFLPQYAQTITKAEGSEPGLVLIYPALNGIACDYQCTEATYNYPTGETVTLEAYEYPGNHLHLKEFTGGTGDAAVCNGETSCSYEVGEEDSSLEAVFVKDAQNTLSLDKEGGGIAFIKSFNGIYCGDYCSSSQADYYSGEEVTVSWTLGTGTSSIEWTTGAGTCTGKSEAAEGSCEVTMSAAKELVAKLE